MKGKKLVPTNREGNQIELCDYDFATVEYIANKRTHSLGLKMTTGEINLKEALCAAYFQGQYDMIQAMQIKNK